MPPADGSHLPQPTPKSHVDYTRARWARYDAESPGFTQRHAECFQADLDSAFSSDTNAEGNERAAAALKAAGGDRQAALALMLGGADTSGTTDQTREDS